MLPYAPLHHLLLADAGVAARADERQRLRRADRVPRRRRPARGWRAIADALLLHDRPIHTRTDDSVARVVGGRPAVLRRSRGLVPAAPPLPVAGRGRCWPAAPS